MAGLAALAITAAMLWTLPERDEPDSAVAVSPALRAGSDQARSQQAAPPGPEPDGADTATEPDRTPSHAQAWPLYQRRQASEDLFALAQSIHENAAAGDAASMWTLGQIYDACELLAVKYGTAATLDSARQSIDVVTAAMPPQAARYHRRQFDRCRGFVEHPDQLENAEIWQTLAAEAGHPAAQLRAWVDRRLDADLGPPSLPRVASLVESGQPDALLLAPRLLRLDTQEAEPTASAINETAWALAACQLGVDCSDQGEITQIRCIWDACAPGDDVVTVLQGQVSPYVFQQARDQATRLAVAIRQGRLDDAGLVHLRVNSSASGDAITQ